MSFFNRLAAVTLAAALIGPGMPLLARTRQGDKDLAQGRVFEDKKDWDKALESYRKALAADPSDIQYQMSTEKARFEGSLMHVEHARKVRAQGSLDEALLEFQRAFAIDPGSVIAVQEVRVTLDMIERERQRVLESGRPSSPEQRALTPIERMQMETEDRLDRMLPVPELRPLGPARLDLQINSNVPKTLFETLGAYAGINVLWDSDMNPPNTAPIKNGAVKFQNTTLDEALDYLGLLTKYFWKPLSANTIFVTVDSKAKRTDYGDQVLRVFYLQNVQLQQEIQEIVNVVRTVCDVQKVSPLNGQNAIVARGEPDQIALVEKIIHDLDRPKSEVVVDIIVMQTSSNYSRQLAAALMPTGLTSPINFAPTNGTTVTTAGTSGSSTSTSTSVPLSGLRLATGDWSTTLPSGLLQAVMSDAGTKILQAPQVRSLDNMKVSLKIGERQPTASGSFGSALGLSGAGVSPLVNTQFQYLDLGVNVDLTPRIHENGDVSMHIELEISSVDGTVSLGGIDEPIIAQKKVSDDIRLREGEVNLLGGLIDVEDDTTKTGVPGLGSIPLLGRLFSSDSVKHTRSELMIALVPHIVRRPVISAESLRTIDVGSATNIHLNYAPRADAGGSAPSGQAGPASSTVLTPAALPLSAPALAMPTTVPAVQPAAPPAGPGVPPMAPGMPGGLPFPLQQLLRPAMPGTTPVFQPGTAPPTAAPAPPPGTASVAPPGSPASASAAAAPAPNATAHFEPFRFDATVLGEFTASLILDSGVDVVSTQPLQLQFDPKLLQLTDVSAGDLFSKDGGTPVFTKDIKNDEGLATIQIGRQPGATGVNAPGTLLTFKFQAIARGAATVNVLNVTVRNSLARAVGSSHPQLTVNIK